MKKTFLSILLSALLAVNICSCAHVQSDPNPTPSESINQPAADQNTSKNTIPLNQASENTVQSEIQTIARGDFYHYYSVAGAFECGYEIYNLSGEVIFSERTWRPLTVSEINPSVIEIRIGYGTGIIGRRYYNAQTTQMSEEFFYVVANYGTKIAYLDGDLDDRKMIVHDVYESSENALSFDLDCARDPYPIYDASFSEDGSLLSISYQSGDNDAICEVTLELS